MAEKAQSYANHARYYPVWHFVAFPILAINVIVAAVVLFRDPSSWTVWQLLVAIALVCAVFASRGMNLMTQDRIIRGEELHRLERLLPDDLRGSVTQLTVGQLVGLRFASDQEVPDLTRRVVAGELKDRKSIKQAIKSWRADHMRV